MIVTPVTVFKPEQFALTEESAQKSTLNPDIAAVIGNFVFGWNNPADKIPHNSIMTDRPVVVDTTCGILEQDCGVIRRDMDTTYHLHVPTVNSVDPNIKFAIEVLRQLDGGERAGRTRASISIAALGTTATVFGTGIGLEFGTGHKMVGASMIPTGALITQQLLKPTIENVYRRYITNPNTSGHRKRIGTLASEVARLGLGRVTNLK